MNTQADLRGLLDPLNSLEDWMRSTGSPEDAIALTRRDLNAFLDAMRRRQQDPAVRAGQDARSREWDAMHASSRRADRHSGWKACWIPEGLWPILDDHKETDAIVEVSYWLGGQSFLMVLSGGPGRGKSVAAAWAIEKNGSGLFVDLGEEAPRRGAEGEYWERIRRARLLVLDELGAEREDARGWWTPAKVSEVVTARWNWGRRTLLTTRRAVEWFASRYDDSLVSRLGNNWVGLAGDDMRNAQ